MFELAENRRKQHGGTEIRRATERRRINTKTRRITQHEDTKARRHTKNYSKAFFS